MSSQPEAPDTEDEITALAKAVRMLYIREQRGALATLRRMNPAEALFAAPFQALLADIRPDALSVHRARPRAVFVRILALPMSREVLQDGGRKLGRQLLEAKISEMRVQRLLQASGDALEDQLSLVARRLANTGVLPFREMGRLLLGDARDAETARYEIARGYWLTRAASPEPFSPGDPE
jgi:hypothetical protein